MKSFWEHLLAFCGGRTDYNQNNTPDNEELLRTIQYLAQQLAKVNQILTKKNVAVPSTHEDV